MNWWRSTSKQHPNHQVAHQNGRHARRFVSGTADIVLILVGLTGCDGVEVDVSGPTLKLKQTIKTDKGAHAFRSLGQAPLAGQQPGGQYHQQN